MHLNFIVEPMIIPLIFNRTLQYLFHDLIAMSNSGMKIKQLRNDVLMICLKIAQLCPDAPFIVSQTFHVIIVILCM